MYVFVFLRCSRSHAPPLPDARPRPRDPKARGPNPHRGQVPRNPVPRLGEPAEGFKRRHLVVGGEAGPAEPGGLVLLSEIPSV